MSDVFGSKRVCGGLRIRRNGSAVDGQMTLTLIEARPTGDSAALLLRDNHVGARIRRIRLERGMKQDALAYDARLSTTTISAIENGRTLPSAYSLLRIAQALGVPVDMLTAPTGENVSGIPTIDTHK
jgi:DNA-binding XRE family transcriptional regulator